MSPQKIFSGETSVQEKCGKNLRSHGPQSYYNKDLADDAIQVDLVWPNIKHKTLKLV